MDPSSAPPPVDGEGPVRVGLGLIGRAGRYLIRRRPPLPGSPMPGYWEFPGGKCHPGESPEQCARRECLEEVGLAVRVLSLRRCLRHAYPHGFVELHFYDCVTAHPGAEPEPSTGFRWVDARDLPAYTFPGANEAVVAELVAESSGRPHDAGTTGEIEGDGPTT